MSREQMIAEMMEYYPYPKKWYDKLTDERLFRVYQHFRNKQEMLESLQREIYEQSRKEPIRYYDTGTGQWMVQTDIHGWEPEEN